MLLRIKNPQNFYLQPISISYSKLDGIPLETKFRPFFAWFGNMDLVSHAWKFLGLGFSEVNVNFHEPKNFLTLETESMLLNIVMK